MSPKVMLTVHFRFAYAVLAADELVAVSNTVKFHYDDGRTLLRWPVGESVDNAIWITAFLVVVIFINVLPVRVRVLLDYSGAEIERPMRCC
jgi:yeast amino acid transporter